MYFTSSTLWLCILRHLLDMLLEFNSGYRCSLSLLSCLSLGVVQLTGAAPTTKPSITAEQYLGLHLQTPKIFFPSSDSQVSRSILSGQPYHAEIDMASPKRLYTCCIPFLLYMLYILSTEHS